MDKIILYAMPVFVLLIAAEWAYGWRSRRVTYRLNDCISSLSQGLLSQAIAVCTQLFQIGLYSIVFTRLALHPALHFWNTPLGWVVAIVLFDFFDYWLHRAGHEVALLWAAHVVHHQSEDFNFSTALRQESFVPLLGWAFYTPMAVLGVPPEQFAIAGLVVLLYQFWIHTEHIGKLGWFDGVFSSPSNHRVHHAINPQYINRNYGGMLIVWDRLFGTFAPEEAPCIYGTTTPLSSWNPVHAVTGEYLALARACHALPHWRDKLRVWFMPPGWAAAQPGAGAASTASSAPRQRYDPPLRRAEAAAATALLLLAMGLTAWLLLRADGLGTAAAVCVCAAIAGTLWSAGAVLENRLSGPRALLLAAALAGAAGLALTSLLGVRLLAL